MDAQQRYKGQQDALIWQHSDPLLDLLLRRRLLQQQISEHRGYPEERKLVDRQQALTRQIMATTEGQRYLKEEAALAQNYLDETGGFRAIGRPHPGPATGPRPRPGYGQNQRRRPLPAPRDYPRPGYVHPAYGEYPQEADDQTVVGLGRYAPQGPPGRNQRGLPAGYPGTGPQRPRNPGTLQRRAAPGRPDRVTGGKVMPRGGKVMPSGRKPPPAKRKGGRRRFATPVVLLLFVAVPALLVTKVSGGSSGYPAAVDQVKQWVQTACQDKNTAIDGGPGTHGFPGTQFACGDGKDALWVFSYMTSGANPNYIGQKPQQNGAEPREGLMPFPASEAQAYSLPLQLGHPIMEVNTNNSSQAAVDSLKVGALVLNAFTYGTIAAPKAGLESSASNCARYTGVAATIALNSHIVVCSNKLTDQGKVALVHDLYLAWANTRWVKVDPKLLGSAANAAAVLFAYSDSPNNPAAKSALKWVNDNAKQLHV